MDALFPHRTRIHPCRRFGRGAKALILAAALFADSASWAAISEPDHILYGTPTTHGEPLRSGLVTLVMNGAQEPIASYEIGSDMRLGDCQASPCSIALRVPMDVGEPRLPATAQRGDEGEIFIDGQLAAQVMIGEPGNAQFVELDTDFLPRIPGLSIVDAVGAEGEAGPFGLDVDITLLLSFPIDRDVTVDWQTADGTAIAASDYEAGGGTVTFPSGATATTLTVTVLDDLVAEADPANGDDGEYFLIKLESPIRAELLDSTARVRIVDDDTPPALSIADLTLVEPGHDSAQGSFAVRLSHAWRQDVYFEVAALPGTADGTDFVLESSAVTIPAGETATQVFVKVFADGEDEEDETFEVRLENPDEASLRRHTAQGTILEKAHLLTYVGHQSEGEDGVDGLSGALDVALSPDGAHLYAASRGEDAITVFARDVVTGDLTFIASYRDGEGGVEDLAGVERLAFSADGERLYAAASDDDAISIFRRDPDRGTLTLVEVERNGGRDLQSGLMIDGLAGAGAMVVAGGVSAGGEHLYVAGGSEGALAIFQRQEGGVLAYVDTYRDGTHGGSGLEKATDLALSPEGTQLYVSSGEEASLAVFDRDPATGALNLLEIHHDGAGGVDGLAGAAAVAVAPDGGAVYVAGLEDGMLAVFDRGVDGRLSFRETAVAGNSLLTFVTDVQVSRDGRYVYATGFLEDALTVFERGADGSLTYLEAEIDGAAGVRGLKGPASLVVSADDRHVYAAGNLSGAAVAFRRDVEAPSGPVEFASTSHMIGVFSPITTVDLHWSGADDGMLGSGVHGYWLLFDESAETEPVAGAPSFFVPHGADPIQSNGPPLADSAGHFAHLRACDAVGNCGPVQHLGPFSIDATPPSAPAAVLTTSHVTPAADATIDVIWEPSVDLLSGVAGYAVSFNQDQSFLCPEAATQSAPAATSPALAHGIWFAQVCAYDVAGNASSVSTGGPFVVDLLAPSQPALSSRHHLIDVWSNRRFVELEWSGAADESGIAGYSYLLDAVADTEPDRVLEQVHGSDPHVYGVNVDDGSHFFHLSTCDAAGGCASQHLGPLRIDTTPPGVVGGLSSPSHGNLGEPSNRVVVEILWHDPGDNLSGVHAFDYRFSPEPSWTCGEIKRLTGDLRGVSSQPLADGQWYFHICAVDLADNWTGVSSLGPMVIDTLAPELPSAFSSPSHVADAWSSDATVDLLWPEAVDDVALAGYSIVFDRGPSTLPDTSLEVAAGADPQSFTSPVLIDGGDHYAHLRSCDSATNCSVLARHAGPFHIDTVAPSAPSSLASPSHTLGGTANDATIEITWSAALDDTSGVEGYAWAFDQDPEWICGDIHAGAEQTAATSPALSDGDWYFHICAFDRADNASDVASLGPFGIDITHPGGVSVASSSHTPSRWSNNPTIDIDWSEASDPLGIAGYSFEFSTSADTEPDTIIDQPHDQDPHSTTSSSLTDGEHYFHLRVCDIADNCAPAVHIGPFWIDTTEPTPVTDLTSPSHIPGTPTWLAQIALRWQAADDDLSGIDGYSLGVGPEPTGTCDAEREVGESTLQLTTPSLDGGSWYTYLCAVDRAGNVSSAQSVGPFLIDPDLTASNRLVNSDFDHDLNAWEAIHVISTEIVWSPDDAEDRPDSGSVLLTPLVEADRMLAMAQCVIMPPEVSYRLAGQARIDLIAEPAVAFATVEFYSSADCTEGFFDAEITTVVAGSTAGAWAPFEAAGETPVGTASALVTIAVDTGEQSAYAANIDRLFFGEIAGLFRDGFESGDVTVWSSSVP